MNLTDEPWRLIEPILPPPSPSDRGRPPLDRRAVLDGILWKFRTDNSATGALFGGYGLFWTQDDIAKIALLLNNQNGVINGTQVLNPGMLADAMQKNPTYRGLDTSGIPAFKYNNAFWAKQWTPSEFRQYTCTFWTPFMSGYGGIRVVMMPNGSTYYYFSD